MLPTGWLVNSLNFRELRYVSPFQIRGAENKNPPMPFEFMQHC